MTAAKPLDEEVHELCERLYLELLKKTLKKVQETDSTELSAATISASRQLLSDQRMTREELVRAVKYREAEGDFSEMPFNVDDAPNTNLRAGRAFVVAPSEE